MSIFSVGDTQDPAVSKLWMPTRLKPAAEEAQLYEKHNAAQAGSLLPAPASWGFLWPLQPYSCHLHLLQLQQSLQALLGRRAGSLELSVLHVAEPDRASRHTSTTNHHLPRGKKFGFHAGRGLTDPTLPAAKVALWLWEEPPPLK